MTFYINHYALTSDVAKQEPIASSDEIFLHHAVKFRFEDGTDVELSGEALSGLIRNPYTKHYQDLLTLRSAISAEFEAKDEGFYVQKEWADNLRDLVKRTDPQHFVKSLKVAGE